MSNPEVASIARISLPSAGQLQAFPSVAIQSTDCSAITNLQTQVAPFIASLVCQLGVINLLRPLIQVINGLPNPSPRALQEFSKAAASFAPCLLSAAPSALLPFLRDLICLQIRSLNCFLRNLRLVANLMNEEPAVVPPRDIEGVLASYGPIIGMIDLAADLFQIAGIQAPRAPTLTSGIDAASLESDQSKVTSYIKALGVLAETLGGC